MQSNASSPTISREFHYGQHGFSSSSEDSFRNLWACVVENCVWKQSDYNVILHSFCFFCFKSHLSLISLAVFPTRLSRQNAPSVRSGSGLIGHFIDVPKLAAKWQDLHPNQHLKSTHEKRMIQQNVYALNHLRICHKACFLDMLKVTWWRETQSRSLSLFVILQFICIEDRKKTKWGAHWNTFLSYTLALRQKKAYTLLFFLI